MRSFLSKAFIAAAALVAASTASAQGSRSDPAWEFSLGALYQNANSFTGENGSSLKTDTDWGFNFGFGYNFNPYIDLLFGFDFQTVGYDAEIKGKDIINLGQSIRISGDYEQFTPFVKVNMNLLPIGFTPFISAGLGYTFVDTNIPTGRVEYGCYWDPWYGQICTGYQNTKTEDEFIYQVGAGLRFDFRNFSMRGEYQKRWIDLGESQDGPGMDQVLVSIVFRY